MVPDSKELWGFGDERKINIQEVTRSGYNPPTYRPPIYRLRGLEEKVVTL